MMKASFKIAQISDTHSFSDQQGLHCGANVYQNLNHVLAHIKSVEDPNVIIFTGDLTQDHTNASYEHFVHAFQQQNIKTPVHFIAGNHDEFSQLNHYLSGGIFNSSKKIENEYWQIFLINSKSDTPSGYIAQETLHWLVEHINTDKKQLVMMHHHPIDVGYFIDKHGLKNKKMFWQCIEQFSSIEMLACGHVHNALSLLPESSSYSVPLYTCPATSIQVDQSASTSACNGQGAGYRVFELFDEQTFTTRTHFTNTALGERLSSKSLL